MTGTGIGSAIDAQRESYRKVYDTGLAGLLSSIWGGNLHMGLFLSTDESLATAQRRVKAHMARRAGLEPGRRVFEAACGVGATARYLVENHRVTVLATNISEMQLEEARAAAAREGLGGSIRFQFADYHALAEPDDSFDCWWCQEALLYAVDKRRVLEEALRVVRAGGRIVFTDLLVTRDMPSNEWEAFLTDMKAPDMWSIEDWDALLLDMRVKVTERQDWSRHTIRTFEKVSRSLTAVREKFVGRIGREAVEGTEHRIRIQLERAKAGQLGWCFYALEG